ncbi:cytochrome c peroxidase [Tundrisphaera lichenicola]|uniref:cytochrome c peroxidase n=1 Tax=Tundrisphaera lichenicola TaxID=2029860 RepID=UPI003EBA4328
MIHRTTHLILLSMSVFFACEIETRADEEPDRSPIALAIRSDGHRLLIANQTSGSVSWIDPSDGRVLDEVKTGDRPAGVAISPDGRTGVVAHWYGYDLAILRLEDSKVEVIGKVEVGPEPRGVVISRDGKSAFVAVGASDEVVRVDLAGTKVSGRLSVGREPRSLALTPDGSRLVVANNRGHSISVVDLGRFEVIRTIPHLGDNLRQLEVGPDGKYAYFSAMHNRGFATTFRNIDEGWVLGQRLFRVALDGSEPAENISLDPRGRAAGDAHGLAIGEKGKLFAVGCGGTHEVMLFREDSEPLPWKRGVGRDVIAIELLQDGERFRRVELGGRPTELAFAPDGRTLYAANYLENAIQVIDTGSARIERTIELGGPSTPSLARRGEALFYDAFRSANNWYSCNTCHSDGHTNGLDYDTMNDGWHDNSSSHTRSRKKAPTLRRVAQTGPWTWHGWQTDLNDAMVESFTKSMQGKKPSQDEVNALVTYLATLDYPRNPNREADGGLSPAAKRGEALFRSNKANCNSCHSGPEFTDGKRHDVGLNERGDVYEGHNPPSLRGVYDKDPYLHDGRAKTLRETLTGDHAPEALGGSEISESELDDLIAYLKSL